MASTPTSRVPADSDWLADWEAAKAKARREHKDLLVDFTGSDWCSWCIRLREEVFDTEEFKQAVTRDFVPVELDFPQGRQLPEELRRQNAMLQARFGVQGYPTVFLTDAEGLPYAKTGYQAGGPGSYLAHLAELRQARVVRDQALARAKQARGAAAAELQVQALAAVPEDLHHLYMDVIDAIIEQDADGKAGLRDRFVAKKLEAQAQQVRQDFMQAMQANDFAAAAQTVAKFLAASKPAGELAQELHYYHGVALLQQEQTAAALAALERARDAAPASENAATIAQAVEAARRRLAAPPRPGGG